MLQLPARQQSARRDQRIHHRLVRRPVLAEILALKLNDLQPFKARRLLRELALLVHRERDAFLAEMLRPDHKVVRTMTRRRVDEARTRVVRDVVAVEQRDVEVVALAAQRMR